MFNQDCVSNGLVKYFNVNCTSPMVMSVRDDLGQTFLSGESSFNFGRSVYGDEDNVRAFNFACSASFSPIECFVHKALFPNSEDLGSVTLGLGYILNHNGTLEIVREGDIVLIRENASDERVLLYDVSTGLLHDQHMLNVSGSYCYSNQQTEWAWDLGDAILDAFESIFDSLTDLYVLEDVTSIVADLFNPCCGLIFLGDLITGGELSDSMANFGSYLDDSMATIYGVIGSIITTASNIDVDYIVNDCLCNPEFISGVAGGVLFEAGMVALASGVGAPIGIALLGAGTLCTAYSCGLFDFDSNGDYAGLTDENMWNFAFSMGLNLIGGGVESALTKSALKKAGWDVVQHSVSKVNSFEFAGGYSKTQITTFIKEIEQVENGVICPSKEKYIINRFIGENNDEMMVKSLKSIFYGVLEDIIWKGYWNYSN